MANNKTFGILNEDGTLLVNDKIYKVKSAKKDLINGDLKLNLTNSDNSIKCKDNVSNYVKSLSDEQSMKEIQVEVDGVVYNNITNAVEAAKDGKTLKLLKNIQSDGVQIKEGYSIIFDLNGFTWKVKGNTGSTGTKTNGFQLLKNSTVTFKNGMIFSEDAKILIQNYSNLTIDNVELYGMKSNQYVVSNNFGNIIFKNGTKIIPSNGNVAFDLYYKLADAYADGVNLKILDNSVLIVGKYEFEYNGKKATEADMWEHNVLSIPINYPLKALKGTKWVASEESGYMKLAKDE